MVAHCNDADCATSTMTPFSGHGSFNPSVTITGNGLPLFSVDDFTVVHVGRCANAACTSASFVNPSPRSPCVAFSTDEINELIRVSGACGTACGPDDVYRLRVYETTLRGTRINNSTPQTTVVILQNTGQQPVRAGILFWSATGTLLQGLGVVPPIAPREVRVIPLAGISALAGQSGSLSVTHDAPYGVLVGKAVALEPAMGFSFDTPLEPRPR